VLKGCYTQRTESREQKAETREHLQRGESREQRAESREQRTERLTIVVGVEVVAAVVRLEPSGCMYTEGVVNRLTG
jgi:hypothetical protein